MPVRSAGIPLVDSAASTADGVTLRQLQYFVAVVREGSFTAAAQTLHIAQPSLSKQVRTLERVVGGPLLARESSGVVPTAAGVLLFAKARAVLSGAHDGVTLARREIEQPGSVCVTVIPGAPSAIVAAAVAKWASTHPDAHVQWVEFTDTRRALAKLAESPSTVAVCAPVAEWEGSRVPLVEESLVLARPAAAASESRLPIAGNGHEWHAASADRSIIGVSSSQDALELVRAGGAVAVLPLSVAKTSGVITQPLPGEPTVGFCGYTAPEATANAAEMLERLREAAVVQLRVAS